MHMSQLDMCMFALKQSTCARTQLLDLSQKTTLFP